MNRASAWLLATVLSAPSAAIAQAPAPRTDAAPLLTEAAEKAQRELQQSFTQLKFEHFAPSPIEGPIYQAMAGGRLLYFAPESEHLIFASVFDRNGTNLTALGESDLTRRKLARIDLSKALTIGPADAPEIIEFTDPDCPHCRALDRFWAAKAAEGKPVRRRLFFVTGIHPEAAAKASEQRLSTSFARWTPKLPLTRYTRARRRRSWRHAPKGAPKSQRMPRLSVRWA
jgi:thiol:disulfide interchange protein DsbC